MEFLIEKQMNGLVEVTAAAARIIPTLDIQRGIGKMFVPHMTEGVRDQLSMELAFSSEQKGDIEIKNYERGVSLIVTRGSKDKARNEIDWRRF